MTASARLVAVDATRGIALLGMMAVHVLPESDANGQSTWSFLIFGGRAAAAFAVLAGATVAFMTGRRRVTRAAAMSTVAALATRALAVGAIGLALGYADAALAAVILPYYAVLFLLAIPLVFLPSWAVALVGVIAMTGFPALTHVLIPELPVPTLLNPTLSYLVHQPVALLSELSVTGEYPALTWLTYLCAGLVVGRMNLARLRTALGLLTAGAALALAAWFVSWALLNHFGGLAQIWAAQPDSVLTESETTDLLALGGDGTTPASTWWWLAVDAPHTGSPPDLMGTTGTAIAMLGGLLALTHLRQPVLRRAVRVVQAPLAAAGGMTLTLYTAHIMFINSDYDTYDSATSYLLQVAAVLLIGLGWRASAGRGPLEALVSALTGRARRAASRNAGSDTPTPASAARPVPDDTRGLSP
ncbi:MAG: DUF1624 domain-containing protein [Kutzneria sp.]|nr:DUF1624 domain-containing protein [Kutzneria sp.]